MLVVNMGSLEKAFASTMPGIGTLYLLNRSDVSDERESRCCGGDGWGGICDGVDGSPSAKGCGIQGDWGEGLYPSVRGDEAGGGEARGDSPTELKPGIMASELISRVEKFCRDETEGWMSCWWENEATRFTCNATGSVGGSGSGGATASRYRRS